MKKKIAASVLSVFCLLSAAGCSQAASESTVSTAESLPAESVSASSAETQESADADYLSAAE